MILEMLSAFALNEFVKNIKNTCSSFGNDCYYDDFDEFDDYYDDIDFDDCDDYIDLDI